jgi:RHS repeat-associated protein
MQPTILRRSVSLLVLLLAATAAMAQEPATNARPSSPSPTSGPYSWTVGPFAYDPSGNVAIIGGSYSIYDPMSRLVTSSVQRPDQMGSQVNTYGYDVYGNRTTVDGGATYAASTSTNQLTGVGAVYDAAGNLTQWQPPGSAFPRQYTYDSLNMITNEVAGSQSVANIYTADDERLWRFDVSNTVSHWTVRDLGGRVLRDFLDDPNDSNGAGWTLYREYIYHDGQLLAVNTPTGTEHDSLDHLGSPRLITDGNRNRIFHHHYLPFGGEWTIGNESVDGSTLRFTSHERDDDLLDQQNGTLDYMHARFYSANMGRFVSFDPVLHLARTMKNPQGFNRYSYAYNNPIKYLDQNGADPFAAFFLGEQARDLSTFDLLFKAPGFDRQLRSARDTYLDSNLNKGETAAYGLLLAAAGYKVLVGMIGGTATATAATSTIMLGENMAERVIPAAEEYGAATIPNLGNGATTDLIVKNLQWLQSQINGGSRILDIGLDAARSTPSAFYIAEVRMLQAFGYTRQFYEYRLIGGRIYSVYQWVPAAR